MNEKISIITVNFNNLTGLKETINSVINQDYANIEYIIIDGGSLDGSAEWIASINDKLYYWVSEKDSGVYQAMNKGIIRATGEYIVFLNSGDYFIDQHVISRCCYEIAKVDEVDIFYGNIFVKNQLNNPDHHHFHPRELSLKFFKNDTINHQASLIKRALFVEFGLYPECYRLASDYWLYIRSLLSNKRYQYLDFPMVIYDFTGISSLDNFKEYKIEQRKIWDMIVPKIVNQLIDENEKLELDIARYQHLVHYKLVKAAIDINAKLQVLRSKTKD